ncbi:MAG TPA: DUF1302 family protein [Solimonas sp.]|nr:DUF1302 family protein [Solimonas sp.]
MAKKGEIGMRTRWTYGPKLLAVFFGAAALQGTVHAGTFGLFGLDGQYQAAATYAAAMRLHDADDRIINSAPAANIPIPDYLKVPESNNYDDGSRNFDKHSLVNNRLTILGEVQLTYEEYGLLVRGDAFHDNVYFRENNNNSPNPSEAGATINKNAPPSNHFSDEAEYYSGQRARLLDHYIYGSWYLTDNTALNIRVGSHIAAWGESLFFSGIALAQSPADATKATVPGADVKSILLPVRQVSMQMSFADDWTLLGQYKLEHKPTELNPVGEFFSIADVVGPGAEFIYGIDNPFFFENLTDVNLLSDDTAEAIDVINQLALPQVPLGAITGNLNTVLDVLNNAAPDVPLPNLGLLTLPGTPRYINVQRGPDIKPSDHGQWGVGIKYQITPNTNAGLYRLRYHNTTPAPVQNYGYSLLIPSQAPGAPDITTQHLGDLKVPVTYNVRYFDGIDMSGLSFSTALFGANVGGELLYREHIDVLVDVDGGLLGPVPSPTRAKVASANINGLYLFGPRYFWDSLIIVADVGYNQVTELEEDACGASASTCTRNMKDLHYSKESSAINILALIDRKNVFNGWDLNVPVSLSSMIHGQSSLLGGFGPLTGQKDKRAGIGVNFTYLQKFTVGASYSGYFGKPHFAYNPYADRDNIGVTLKYNF